MISVIIPCKDRIKSLKKCLSSVIHSANYATNSNSIDIEIIVVNDNSKIGFAEEVNKFFPYVNVYNSIGKGPGFARNYGLENSNGDYVFYTDSDCIVDKNWIIEGYHHFIKTDSAIIQGVPWLFQKENDNYYGNQEEKLYELLFSTYIDGHISTMTDSRNLLVNKRKLNGIGKDLFSVKSEEATAESRAFAQKLLTHGLTISWNGNIKVYHEDPMDLITAAKQKFRHGSGRIEIWNTIPNFDHLESRYFTIPIQHGIDKSYVVPVHFAFLFGYFKNINNENALSSFIDFFDKIKKKYQCKTEIITFMEQLKNQLN